MTKSELARQLWADTFVSRGNLANVVLELRRALHDERPSKLVGTVHRVGYSFIGETRNAVERVATQLGRFRVLLGGQEIGLEDGDTLDRPLV